jgi:hypothetical protein
VVTLRFKSALALLKGYGSLVRHLPEVLKKRGEVQVGRKVSDRFLTENGLIISLAAAIKEFIRLRRS